MRRPLVCLCALVLLLVPASIPAGADTGPAIHGGGSATDMTRFALAVQGGTGHFECLMPALMTVEATVTGVDSATAAAASFHGTAQVTVAASTGTDAGPMVRNEPFTATVLAGGAGAGYVDLEIMGMSFKGAVEHGQVSITP